MLIQETEDDTDRWKYIMLLEQKNQYIVKEIILFPKTVPIKLPMSFFRTGTILFIN